MPVIEKPIEKAKDEQITIIDIRNKELADQTYLANNPSAADFYTTYDKYAVTEEDKRIYNRYSMAVLEGSSSARQT